MQMLTNIIYIAVALLFMWMLYRNVKNNPEAFSATNLNKSAYTLGVLALILICLIGLVVMLLRA